MALRRDAEKNKEEAGKGDNEKTKERLIKFPLP